MFCYYIVKPGDTVYKIAMRHRIAPCLLIRLNQIRRPNDIRPGMKLIVPCMDGVQAKNAFDVDLNHMDDSIFNYCDVECQIGQDIIAGTGETMQKDRENGTYPIPGDMGAEDVLPDRRPGGGENAVPVMPNGEYMIGDVMKFTRHTVKPGDSVYQIAKKYNTTMHHIIIANGLRPPYLIFPGQELIVPYTDEKIKFYTVKEGDTVYSIARAYSVPVENILHYNYLDSEAHIYPGQRLIVKM